MANVKEAIASFERNIEEKTGRSVSEWIGILQKQRLPKHGQMVAWLKSDQGLSHAHANHVAKRALEAAARHDVDDPILQLFINGKDRLRPIYDRLVDETMRFGPDVELAPKKANVSVRRRRQFALIQPSTKTRLDLGLILDCPPTGNLELAGSFNAMFTHRVKLSSIEDVNAEVVTWLREAYDAAK